MQNKTADWWGLFGLLEIFARGYLTHSVQPLPPWGAAGLACRNPLMPTRAILRFMLSLRLAYIREGHEGVFAGVYRNVHIK